MPQRRLYATSKCGGSCEYHIPSLVLALLISSHRALDRWRVTEISQILLILLDSRCPTLHLPPALSAYLSSVSNASRLRMILVLTKVDIAGPDRAAAWTKYLSALHPGTRVVQVESYMEKHPGGEGSSKKRMFEPHLPSAFRKTLVDALRETHAELLEPPSAVKNNPERLATWKPRIKSEVDWDAVLKAHGGQVGTAVGGPKHKTSAAPDDAPAEEHPGDDDSEPEVLTIGLIGKPLRQNSLEPRISRTVERSLQVSPTWASPRSSTPSSAPRRSGHLGHLGR